MKFRMSQDASLHEKTVIQISEGEVPKLKKATPSKPRVVHYSQAQILKVNPLIWKKVRQLVKGDFARIEIIDPENVVVHNNGNWKEYRAIWNSLSTIR